MNKEAISPNILLLLPDQHRGDWLPFPKEVSEKMGLEKLPLKMPNIRKLMNKGTTFTRAISSSPLCAPARACLASGLKYENCKVADNSENYPLYQKTFYSVLRDKGYSVGGVGKFDLHKPTHWWGLSGWTEDLASMGFTHGIDNAGKLDAVVSGRYEPKDPYMKHLHKIGMAQYHCDDLLGRGYKTHPTALKDEDYCDNWIGSNAISMIKSFSKEKPWFMQVNFTGPHDPFDVTKKMKERWKDAVFPKPAGWNQNNDIDINSVRQNYAAMLENIDRNIELIIQEITNRNELENTIIIYSSDHGEMLGDFNMFGKAKHQKPSIHIPLIIKGPEFLKGIYSDALVELQDLTCTITESAGTQMSEAKDSLSLLPILTGKRDFHRTFQSCGLKIKGKDNFNWKVVYNNDYKVVSIDDKKIHLYHVKEDLLEQNDIYEENKDIAENLLKKRFLTD